MDDTRPYHNTEHPDATRRKHAQRTALDGVDQVQVVVLDLLRGGRLEEGLLVRGHRRRLVAPLPQDAVQEFQRREALRVGGRQRGGGARGGERGRGGGGGGQGPLAAAPRPRQRRAGARGRGRGDGARGRGGAAGGRVVLLLLLLLPLLLLGEVLVLHVAVAQVGGGGAPPRHVL